jgi:hypothetical protein
LTASRATIAVAASRNAELRNQCEQMRAAKEIEKAYHRASMARESSENLAVRSEALAEQNKSLAAAHSGLVATAEEQRQRLEWLEQRLSASAVHVDAQAERATQVAYAGRRPTLSVRPAEQVTAADAKVATAISAKAAEAVTWTSADEAWVRETIGMPELQTVEDVDGESLLVDPMAAPAVPAAPVADAPEASAEMADDTVGPPALVQQSAADGLYARNRSPSEMRGLQNRMDLQLAKKLAAGQGLSHGELRYIESALRFIGDPTVKPDYALHGPTYQEFHGLGGQAMVSWLGGVLADTDGVAPVSSPDPAMVPDPMAELESADYTGRWWP